MERPSEVVAKEEDVGLGLGIMVVKLSQLFDTGWNKGSRLPVTDMISTYHIISTKYQNIIIIIIHTFLYRLK